MDTIGQRKEGVGHAGCHSHKGRGVFLRYSETKEFTVYEVEIELVKAKEVVPLRDKTIAEFLTEQDINVVLCANIRSAGRTLLRTKRIELIYGVTGNADEAMIRYLSGEQLGTVEENALLRMELDERI